jgi:hypothetical protein
MAAKESPGWEIIQRIVRIIEKVIQILGDDDLI